MKENTKNRKIKMFLLLATYSPKSYLSKKVKVIRLWTLVSFVERASIVSISQGRFKILSYSEG